MEASSQPGILNSAKRIVDYSIVFSFLIFIFIPALTTKISNEDNTEQRKLSTIPHVEFDVESLSKFPKEFENFFNDHFGFRSQLVRIFSTLKLKLGSSSSVKVIVGKDGWFFYTGFNENGKPSDGNPVGDYQKNDPFTENELSLWKKDLEMKYYGLKAEGIDYVFIIAPNKSTIYGEYMPPRFKVTGSFSRYDQLIEYMKNSPVPIIDLRPTLFSNKDPKRYPLYDEEGTHWNAYGANFAQYEIAFQLSKIYPEIKPIKYGFNEFELKENRADMGLVNLLNLKQNWDSKSPALKNENIEFTQNKIDHKAYFRSERTDGFFYTKRDSYFSDKNVLVFRDSFFQQLQPYFSMYFKKVTYIWSVAELNLLESAVNDIPCNLVVEERVERYLQTAPKNQFNNKYSESRVKQCFDKGSKVFSLGGFSDKIPFSKSNQLSMEKDSNAFSLNANGNDPFFEIPKFSLKPNEQILLKIALWSPADTEFQLFYQTADTSHFREKNSLRFALKKGFNDFYINIDDPDLNGRIRIDPGRLPGEYRITELEIRTYAD